MTSAQQYDAAAARVRRPADPPDEARELIRLATLAASSHNTQPWRFRAEGRLITISPDLSRRCPVVDPDDAHLFKSIGCAAENLVQAATAAGFDPAVEVIPGDGCVVVRLGAAGPRRQNVLAYAIPHRQCVRAPYDGRQLAPAEVDELARAGEGRGVRVLMLTGDPQKEQVVEYVTEGNRTQLTDPGFRKELAAWIRFNPREALAAGDGLAGRAAGQPALPRWLARVILPLVLTAKGQARTDAANIRSSAGIAVFVSDADDRPAWVEAGRAYERFALRATAMGVRNAFVNQPLEVKSIRPQFERWLGVAGHALLVVRFGRGPVAPFSLRRPVEEVIDGVG